jgi:hypothetical protein
MWPASHRMPGHIGTLGRAAGAVGKTQMPTDNRHLEALLRELGIQPRDSRELEDREQSDEGTSTEERDPERVPLPEPLSLGGVGSASRRTQRHETVAFAYPFLPDATPCRA